MVHTCLTSRSLRTHALLSSSIPGLNTTALPSSSVSVTHGDTSLTLTGVSVSQTNGLLGTSYQLYRHAGTTATNIRTVGYAFPAALHGHVQTVAPTTYFASPRTQRQLREHSGRATAGLAKAESGEPVTVTLRRDYGDTYRAAVPALAVQHVCLRTRCNGPERARDCGIWGAVPEPDRPGDVHAQIPLRRGRCTD